MDKLTYDNKLFGLFKLQNLDSGHPITGELDDEFWCPQSRYAGIDGSLMEGHKGWKVKSTSPWRKGWVFNFETLITDS